MSEWYQPDPGRVPWCLLRLTATTENDTKFLSAWTLGDGNADQLVDTRHETIDTHISEQELLAVLAEALDNRRYTETIIITPTSETLGFLRSRLISVETTTQPSLRGFRHVAITDLLTEYFATNSLDPTPPIKPPQNNAEPTSRPEQQIRTLWEWYTTLVPLIPPTAVLGTTL